MSPAIRAGIEAHPHDVISAHQRDIVDLVEPILRATRDIPAIHVQRDLCVLSRRERIDIAHALNARVEQRAEVPPALVLLRGRAAVHHSAVTEEHAVGRFISDLHQIRHHAGIFHRNQRIVGVLVNGALQRWV